MGVRHIRVNHMKVIVSVDSLCFVNTFVNNTRVNLLCIRGLMLAHVLYGRKRIMPNCLAGYFKQVTYVMNFKCLDVCGFT